jgi:hypothetical protein
VVAAAVTRKKRPAFLGTYVAVAALAGLGAYIYFVESKRPAGDEKPKEKVFTFDRTRAREVALTGAGRETVRLVKGAAGWQITQPQPAPADGGEVDALLSALETLEVANVVAESPESPAEYGLATPRAGVQVTVEGQGPPLGLEVGDKTPDGASVYARIAGKPRVFTVPSYLEGSFTKTAFDLRDRDLLRVKRDAVRQIVSEGPDGRWAVQRNGDEWAFTEPIRTRAGRWPVDGLAGSLETLRMDSVVAEDAKDLAPFGLARPARRVTAVLADGGQRTLEIGTKTADGKYHARVAGSAQVVTIAPAVPDDLAKGMGEYRARRLLDVATHEVEGLEIEKGGAKQVYARASRPDPAGGETHTWSRTAPDRKEIPSASVQDVLFELGGVDVASFVDAPQAPAAYGLDAPALKATLKFTDGRAAQWFLLGQKDGKWYARRNDDAAILVLDPAKASALVDRIGKL